MSETLYIIISLLVALIIVILASFSVANNRLKQRHLRTCANDEALIAVHKKQLRLRNLRLHSYDFLLHNLKEVLQVQSVPEPLNN
jgi:hypothetical protein